MRNATVFLAGLLLLSCSCASRDFSGPKAEAAPAWVPIPIEPTGTEEAEPNAVSGNAAPGTAGRTASGILGSDFRKGVDTTARSAGKTTAAPENQGASKPKNDPPGKSDAARPLMDDAPKALPDEPRPAPDDAKAQDDAVVGSSQEDAQPSPRSEPERPRTPVKVAVWRGIRSPSDLTLTTQRKLKVREDDLKDVSYRHPFVRDAGDLAPLIRRVVAHNSKSSNFDMRDAILLPPPATLEARLPEVRDASLSMSYCILDRAFAGRNSKKLTLVVTLRDGSAARELYREELDVKTMKGCKDWEDEEFPLGDVKGSSSLDFEVISSKGDETPRQALALSNLTVLSEVKDEQDARDKGLDERLGATLGPNLVIVFVDAARGDCVGPGNKTFPSVTPHLDALAADGAAFVNAFTVSNQTRPSIVGFLQSLHPSVGGFHSRFWNLKEEKIEQYYATDPALLPPLLAEAGYITASIGRNHFQYGTSRLGLDPGFDIVWDNRRSQTDTVNIINRAREWLDANKDKKFLLLVNISPPHQPYNPPKEFMEWTEKRLADYSGKRLPARKDYIAELNYADSELGRFFEKLQEHDLVRNSAMLVTADHGETMHYKHHCHSKLFDTICHNSHGLTLFDEEIHVPLIWRAPFLDAPVGLVIENVISHLDVAPTLLDLAGLALHPRHMGRSLLSDLLGDLREDEDLLLESRLARAVRLGGYKYILHHRKDDARTEAWLSGPKGTLEELYNLMEDPEETRNLSGKEREKAVELREVLNALVDGYNKRLEAVAGIPWEPRRTRPLPSEEPSVVPSEAPEEIEPVAEPPEDDKENPEAGSSRSHPKSKTEDESSTAKESPGDLPTSEGSQSRPESGPTEIHRVASAASGVVRGGHENRGKTDSVDEEDDPEPGGEATKFQPPAAPVASGHLYFVLSADRKSRRFEGRITTTGRFVSLDARVENRCVRQATDKAIDLDCLLESESFWGRLQVDPPQSPVFFDLSLDDEPLGPQRFYVGRHGLALTGTTALADDGEWGLAFSRATPHFLAGHDAGIFAWHDVRTLCPGGSESGDFMSDDGTDGPEQINDEATRQVLKDWGYMTLDE